MMKFWFARKLSIACLLMGFATAGHALGADPVVRNVMPRGAQRGTEVELSFNGERLGDAAEVIMYEPGIEVLDFKVENDKLVKARVKLSSDQTPGIRHLRLRTKSGMSKAQNFAISALPVVEEVEPNNEFVKPQVILNNVTINGVVTNEDVDYFVVDAKAGERLTAEVVGIRLGNSMFDPYVSIINESRFELAGSDDAAFGTQDGVASIVVPKDGKYIVMVRESSYGGSGDSYYQLHIGNYPRPLAIVPAGGKPGSTVSVTYYGDVKGPLTRDVVLPTLESLPASSPLNFTLSASDDSGTSPTGNAFRLTDLENVIEAEPNDSMEQAPLAVLPAAMNGILQTEGDRDLFAFEAKKGENFEFVVYGRRLRSEMDSVLQIWNDKGNAVANSDDSPGTPDSQLRFNCPADGKYFVMIRDHLGRGGNAYHYRIEANPITPRLDFSINEFVQFQEDTLELPAGGRLPFLVTATRRDVGGPIEFRSENLPQGVTIEAPQLADGQGVAQVVLVAAPDAPLSLKMSQIVGFIAADPNRHVEGRVRQDAVMVRGQNNRPFFIEALPALAVSVVEPVPFSVEIVQPKVPLIKNSPLKLKLIAKREGDFKGPINVELLQNPPGVNSSRNAVIAEGQTETVIDVNAAGNAPVGDWKICARVRADAGGSRISASPFVALKVAEPYVKLEFAKSAVEQNAEIDYPVKVEQVTPFEGTAKVVLMGLPHQTTAEPLEMTKETQELVFKIKAGPEAPVSKNKNLFCQIIIQQEGEEVIHHLGSGELRIDKPLPPKTTPAPAPTPQVAETPKPPATKPLSRLEQLRLEQQQKAAAGQAP